jgi:hypothetical protein
MLDSLRGAKWFKSALFPTTILIATAISFIGNGLYGVFAARNLAPSQFAPLASLLIIMGLIAIWSSGIQFVAAGVIVDSNTGTGALGTRSKLLDGEILRIAVAPTAICFIVAIPLAELFKAPLATTAIIAMLPYPALLMSKGFGVLIGEGKRIRWQLWRTWGVAEARDCTSSLSCLG